jgi:acyl-CoA thioesterase I
MRNTWTTMAAIFCALAVMQVGARPPSVNAGPAPAGPVRIVALGDSLTAGYGVKRGEDFVSQLGKALAAGGRRVELVNAGVSGDTSADGLARLDWSVPDGTDAVIVELGANDALRGLDPGKMRANLAAIVGRLKERRIAVLLVGMRAVKNWGEAYERSYDDAFAALGKSDSVLYYPFFLDGVALDPALNQDDGMHPNARGVDAIVERILPAVETLIDKAEAARTAAARG